jgi:hypothetical protein
MSDAIVSDEDVQRAWALTRELSKVLVGKPPALMGVALADATAMWLAGHYKAGPETIERLARLQDEMVRRLLSMQIDLLKRRTS